jgi:hypothetical protein
MVSAAHREADDFLGGASLPVDNDLLVCESDVAFSKHEVEADRLHVKERECALVKKEAELTLREAEVARELDRLESMEAQIIKSHELLDDCWCSTQRRSHTVGESPEESMMSTAPSFPSVRNQGLIDQ